VSCWRASSTRSSWARSAASRHARPRSDPSHSSRATISPQWVKPCRS
jgi:hypothetical protein